MDPVVQAAHDYRDAVANQSTVSAQVGPLQDAVTAAQSQLDAASAALGQHGSDLATAEAAVAAALSALEAAALAS